MRGTKITKNNQKLGQAMTLVGDCAFLSCKLSNKVHKSNTTCHAVEICSMRLPTYAMYLQICICKNMHKKVFSITFKESIITTISMQYLLLCTQQNKFWDLKTI